MVLDQQLARQFVDRGCIGPTMPLDREQRLVLLRGEPDLARRALAEGQEAAQRIAKRGEHPVLGRVEVIGLRALRFHPSDRAPGAILAAAGPR